MIYFYIASIKMIIENIPILPTDKSDKIIPIFKTSGESK